MKRTSSILDRARTVLKTTGTLGAASAGQFIDSFCDEVERKTYEQADKKAEIEDCSQESVDCKEEDNEK